MACRRLATVAFLHAIMFAKICALGKRPPSTDAEKYTVTNYKGHEIT